MNYRPDIDGLRAVAVLPVIFFHAKLPFFEGGFVGVDVFFVISGFLITSIIIQELESKSFSIILFFERRARRLLPALFTVISVSILLSWVSLFPVEMKDFSQSLIAVSTFSSNILFWLEADYWATISELKPLLHTWSLAVEEQYYLFFPVLMLLGYKINKKYIFPSVLILLLISFFASNEMVVSNPQAAFYLIPFRAWELLVGSVGAFIYHNRNRQINPNSSVANFGFFLIICSIFYYDENTLFPSFYTLLPTVGTILVILFIHKRSFLYKLLSMKYVIFLGMLSYSAYLWHQPLFAFIRNITINEPSHISFGLLIVFNFLMAYLTWRFVEKPFRSKAKMGTMTMFSFSAVGMLTILTIGIVGHANKGFQNRDNGVISMRSLAEKLQVNKGLSYACDGKFTLADQCRTDENPNIAIWGDSYAMHLVRGIQSSKSDVKLIQHTLSGCSPLDGIAVANKSGGIESASKCLEFNRDVKGWLKKNEVEFVVVSSALDSSLNLDSEFITSSNETKKLNYDQVGRAWFSTLEFISSLGATPVIISPPPVSGRNIGTCLAKSDWFGGEKSRCNFANDNEVLSNYDVFNFLERFNHNFKYYDLKEMMCDDTKCRTFEQNIYYYRDPGHLSIEGVEYLGKKFNFHKLITE